MCRVVYRDSFLKTSVSKYSDLFQQTIFIKKQKFTVSKKCNEISSVKKGKNTGRAPVLQKGFGRLKLLLKGALKVLMAKLVDIIVE